MCGKKSKDSKHARPSSLNKFMHPRNPYKNLPSFKELAITYPEFRSHCSFDFKGKAFLDFKNTEALKALTTCLLHKDFGLKVHIPDNRLVPTLPLRMNYLLWIEDLLTLIYPKVPVPGLKASIVGVDIGTGAACVYPLLGNKKFGWHFVATETDALSYDSAKANVDGNDLQDDILLLKSSELFDVVKEKEVREFVRKKKGIHVGKTSLEEVAAKDHEPGSSLKPDEVNDSYFIDFTICNPPFFSSEVEMDTNHNSKKETRSQPNSVSTGSVQEKITDGGEISFITKLIEKSLEHKDNIRIFSTLVGIKTDVKVVINLIKEKAKDIPVCISDTEFCQGRTMRWGVAWSFCSQIPLERVISKKKKLSQKPYVLQIPRSLMTNYTVSTVWSLLQSWLKDIKIKPQIVKLTKYYMFVIIKAYKPTWLHQRQKRRQKMQKDKDEAHMQTEESHSESEYSPHKRKPEEEYFEGNLLKRLKLQIDESNEEQLNESLEEQMNESNEEHFDESIEEQVTDINEEIQMNESNEIIDSKLQTSESNNEISRSEDRFSECDKNPFKGVMDLISVKSNEGSKNEDKSSFAEKEHVADKQEKSSEVKMTSSGPVQEKGSKGGLECFLKCSMQLKQTGAQISLELNFLSGIGNKDAMHQLLQYISNRLRQNK